MNYIGMDCHIASMDFAVVNETGKVVKAERVETSVENLITFIKGIKRPRAVYMEEGALADWMLEVCTDYGETLVITNAKENKWISSTGLKNDKLDAVKLAQLARGGYIKEVYHPVGQRRRFRELVIAYYDTAKSWVRIKNKIKAKFRGNGIWCSGSKIYAKAYREEWRNKLPDNPTLLLIVDGLWSQLDQLEETGSRLLAAIKAQSKEYSEIKRFKKIPGIGSIHAATISAILETPWRFADKRKLWMYAGLGIVKRSSGDKVYSERLTGDYNRLLKYTVKQAAESAIRAKDNPFRRKYLDMILVHGVATHRAKLTIARDLLATMLAMWKKGEEYRPEARDKDRQTRLGMKLS